ncbi:MAG: ABC transporter ATP-binding protein/permease, partial [Alphaproteobacteria bacterium]|nr:ABC transporter ATP-binding protein/permease [Alphaproteobacteria bacterium]
MKNPFVHYLRLQERFVFQTRVQAVALVMGGVILSILDLVGVTAIFPLMLVILDPEMATKGVILGAIYNGFGFKSISAFATFLASTVIILFGIKVIFNLILWRYEFSLLNKWQIKISSTIFDLMLYTDFKNINSQSSGSFINILTSVVPYITRNYIHQCIALMQTAILAALIISYMLYVNYMLFLFVCISSSLLIFIFMSLQRNHMRVLGKKGQDLARDLLEVLQQSIAGFKETKIHQKEGYFYDKFTGTSKKSAKTDLSLLFAQNLPNVLIEYIVITIVFGVFALMLLVSEALQSSAVQISVIVLLGLRVTPLINRTITSLALINSALGPIDQLLEIEETLRSGNLPEKEKEEEKRGQGCIIDFNESICLENVSFKYDDTQNACLKDINLIINKNEHIGIVGASGSGKTTLVNIILGFLTDYDGKYTIDGKEIRGEFIYGMRRITSFVDQQPFLLDGDYIANIAYGVEKIDVDKERVIKC